MPNLDKLGRDELLSLVQKYQSADDSYDLTRARELRKGAESKCEQLRAETLSLLTERDRLRAALQQISGMFPQSEGAGWSMQSVADAALAPDSEAHRAGACPRCGRTGMGTWTTCNGCGFPGAPAPVRDESALLDALTHAAVLECERAVTQAREFWKTGKRTASHDGEWDTCFRFVFEKVFAEHGYAPGATRDVREQPDETVLGADCNSSYRLYEFMGHWSWCYTETHDGHTTKAGALAAALGHRRKCEAAMRKPTPPDAPQVPEPQDPPATRPRNDERIGEDGPLMMPTESEDEAPLPEGWRKLYDTEGTHIGYSEGAGLRFVRMNGDTVRIGSYANGADAPAAVLRALLGASAPNPSPSIQDAADADQAAFNAALEPLLVELNEAHTSLIVVQGERDRLRNEVTELERRSERAVACLQEGRARLGTWTIDSALAALRGTP